MQVSNTEYAATLPNLPRFSDSADPAPSERTSAMQPNESHRDGFATHLGFVLAAVGSAIGLGNIWKFPYITGVHGGGAFVLVYLLCILLVGLPLMIAELSLGQRTGKNLQGALAALTTTPMGRRLGKAAGLLAVATSFLVVSYYGVIAGYTMHFMGTSAGLFALTDPASPNAPSEYAALSTNAPLAALWFTVFTAIVIAVVNRGIEGGIERVCRWMMPTLFALLLALVAYVAFNGYAAPALRFLFEPKWEALTSDAVLEALGHAFFSLSIGMGTMVVYGSYLKTERSILRDSFTIVTLDTLIALLAGIVIFSAIFAGDADPSSGPGLLFETLPPLFDTMPGGTLVAVAFFTLVFFAAWSSAISMLEVVVAWLVDEFALKRKRATLLAGTAVWLTGLTCAFSHQIFSLLENTTGKLMPPLGGLLVAICAGWYVAKKDREIGFQSIRNGALLARFWSLTLKTLTPALVALVLLSEAGAL
ncbi:MAG: NSS family neurotransmitter:Na+ symporter [Chlamydiales bacterium]|jgi:NSS family neurotransmitter:Na+ symporter